VRKDLKRFRQGKSREGLMDVTEKRLQQHDDRRRKAAMYYPDVLNLPFKCAFCTRTFRRRRDIARHNPNSS